MNDYELTLVVDPDLKLEDQKKLMEKIEKLLTQAKGKVKKTVDWGKKELAYPINKKTIGYFYHLLFSVEPKAVPAIDRKIKLENAISRYLLVKTEGKQHGAKISQ